MRFLTQQECATWCEARGYPLSAPVNGKRDLALDTQSASHDLPYQGDCGKRVYIAKQVVSRAVASGPALLWVSDWAVWPTSQHLPLFSRFREALGERRPLSEAPGHLVGPDDEDDAVSVLAMALLFAWNCAVLTDSLGPTYFCSHDERSAAFVPPGQSAEEFVRVYSEWCR
jgi:hypothetical protein